MNKLTQEILRRQSPLPLGRRSTILTNFFQSPMGRSILADEQVAIDNALEKAFGFHLLQMSPLSRDNLYSASMISHKFKVDFSLDSKSSASVFLDELALPFESDSIDVVVLHHMLDYSLSPHDLLKEIRRIVRPGGDIIIIGFNPFSLMGAMAQIKCLYGHSFWQARMLSVSRLVDWLTLLDISVQKVEYAFFRLPFNLSLHSFKAFLFKFFGRKKEFDSSSHANVNQQSGLASKVGQLLCARQFSFGAGSYVATAKNEYIPLTPKRKRWQSNAGKLVPQVKSGYCSDTFRSQEKKYYDPTDYS